MFTIVLFAAASFHCATVFIAMLFGALMRMTGMMGAMIFSTASMVLAMCAMLGCTGAMFCANRIVAVRMICAMRFAIVLADGFLFAMSDASFALFAFGFFAMLHTIVFYRL